MKHLFLVLFGVCMMACHTNVASGNIPLDTLIVPTIEVPRAEIVSTLPDFSQYLDVQEKKKMFFELLRPMIEEENARILWERERIKHIFSSYSSSDNVPQEDIEWLGAMAKQMRMKNFTIADRNQRNILLQKKDIVPVSLCLAQAANESAWGTSRFAREANNLFGQWCFTPGCGIAPAQRAKGETNQVRRFASVNASVNSYVRNINSHNAYKNLRVMREQIRRDGRILDGQSLAKGLTKYSARGEAYVKEIQSIIRVNHLE